MKITNCNCGKLIDCGCTLSFDQYDNNTISILSVSNLVGGTCTLDDYVIDWYEDGEYAFTSASDIGLTTPEATVFHPFFGEAAIPIVAGSYVPVVRFIVIAGVKLFVNPVKCKDWCNVISNLPEVIVVNALTCGTTGGTVPNANYQYGITFNYAQDYALASRTLRIYVVEATKYVAFHFEGYSVADRIDVYLNEELTPIRNASYIVGTRFNNWQVTTPPYQISTTNAKFIVPLPAYTEGNYLRIVITPSVAEVNPLTNWLMAYKCLDMDLTSECNAFTAALSEINPASFNFAHNPANCGWEFTFTMPYTGSYSPAVLVPTLSKYLYFAETHTNTAVGGNIYSASLNRTTKAGLMRLGYGRSGGNAYYLAANTFVTTAGIITVNKTGDIFRWTYDEDADYDRMYNGYLTLLATLWDDNYVADTTNYNHYVWLRIQDRYSDIGCGDVNFTLANYYFHYLSTVTVGVDGTGKKYFQVEATSIVNGVTQIACDTAYTSLDNVINAAMQTKNLANFTYTTRCSPLEGPMGFRSYANDLFTTGLFTVFGYYLYTKDMAPHDLGRFCAPVRVGSSSNIFYWFAIAAFGVEITNQADPANNYRISENLNETTGCTEVSYTTLIQVP
jgi:hypothetical protein